MSKSTVQKLEHYFVPLGREPGGYLDLLGLRPDSDAGARGRKENEYRQQIKKDALEERKKWKAELDAKKITQEEFDAKLQVIEDEKTKREKEFNELKKNFDKVVAERRKMANEGRRDTTSTWVEAFPQCADLEDFWRVLVAARPLPQFSVECLNALVECWLMPVVPPRLVAGRRAEDIAWDLATDFPVLDATETKRREKWFKDFMAQVEVQRKKDLTAQTEQERISRTEANEAWAAHRQGNQRAREVFARQSASARQAAGQRKTPFSAAAGFNQLAHHRLFGDEPLELHTLTDLVAQRETLSLLSADALWQQVQGTNRGFWRRQLAVWIDEVGQLGPQLLPQRIGTATESSNEQFPYLSRPLKRSIDRLEEKDLGELTQEPNRQQAQFEGLPASMGDLFRRLLSQAQARNSSGDAEELEASAEIPLPGAGMSMSELAELLKLFGEEDEHSTRRR